MGNRKPSTPTLVTNPATDMAFSTCAQSLLEQGAASIGELERALQVVYPHAAVHARELANESVVIWYVYREGRWVSPQRSPTVTEEQPSMPDREDDLRATEESIHRDAERLRTIEEEKSALDPADPRVVRLSERAERVAAGLHDKATAERALSEEIESTG